MSCLRHVQNEEYVGNFVIGNGIQKCLHRSLHSSLTRSNYSVADAGRRCLICVVCNSFFIARLASQPARPEAVSHTHCTRLRFSEIEIELQQQGVTFLSATDFYVIFNVTHSVVVSVLELFTKERVLNFNICSSREHASEAL